MLHHYRLAQCWWWLGRRDVALSVTGAGRRPRGKLTRCHKRSAIQPSITQQEVRFILHVMRDDVMPHLGQLADSERSGKASSDHDLRIADFRTVARGQHRHVAASITWPHEAATEDKLESQTRTFGNKVGQASQHFPGHGAPCVSPIPW